MYEFIILAQLMHGPSHGYLIAKVINDIIGPYARLSSGRLYPLLTKLEENGLIAAELASSGGKQGDRQLRIYHITEAGRLRFHVLMGDTGSNPGDYRELFHLKVCYFGYVAPAERLRLIDHYILYCQNHVFHLQSEIDGLIRYVTLHQPVIGERAGRLDAYSLERTVDMMRHRSELWQAEIAWARQLRVRELELAGQAGEQMATDSPSPPVNS